MRKLSLKFGYYGFFIGEYIFSLKFSSFPKELQVFFKKFEFPRDISIFFLNMEFIPEFR